MHLHHASTDVPFGATVTLAEDDSVNSIVSDGGSVYLTGMPQQGDILAQWGKGKMRSAMPIISCRKRVKNWRN